MARILLTIENNWYNEIRSLKNYDEKSIETRILKYRKEIFSDFYCIQSSHTFENTKSKTSRPDIILVAKDFKRWIIVEIETIGKGLSHTKSQLEVFVNCVNIDAKKLYNQLKSKEGALIKHESQVVNLFTTVNPEVLVIFDGYDKDKIEDILSNFKVSIASFEVYKTNKHSGEALKIYGDYPYQTHTFTFLKPRAGDFAHYDVSQSQFFKDPRVSEIDALHSYKLVKIKIIRSGKTGDMVVKIPEDNPFEPGKALLLEQTIGNKFIIKPL